MNQKIFSIFDVKAQAYLPPFFMHREQMAQRAFGECVQSSEHQFSKHPQDFTLFHIGDFDDATAVITPCSPQSLGNGLEYVFESKDDRQVDAFPEASDND